MAALVSNTTTKSRLMPPRSHDQGGNKPSRLLGGGTGGGLK